MTALAFAAAPATNLPPDYGRFSWDVRAGTAFWSDSVYHLYGYRPGQITPTAALALGHKHPEDLHGCVDALHAGILTNRLIVAEHRVVDTHERVRPALVVARPVTDGQGRLRTVGGFVLAVQDAGLDGRPVLGGAVPPLVPVLMRAFGIGEAAARTLLAARRPVTARRTPQERMLAQRYGAVEPGQDLRRTLADTMFPLDHLGLGWVDLAA